MHSQISIQAWSLAVSFILLISLFVSISCVYLFIYFALFSFVLVANFCPFFCLRSLSLLPYFSFSSTLFSLQVLKYLGDHTPCLASFQASGCFNAPISLLPWLIQSEKRKGGAGKDSAGQNKFFMFYWENKLDWKVTSKHNAANGPFVADLWRIGALNLWNWILTLTYAHIHKQNLWPQSWLGGIDLIGLWLSAASHLLRSMDHWLLAQHGGSESLGSLTEISCGPLSKRILAELSTFKAMTCPSNIPAETLCCHEYGHEYSMIAFFFFPDGVERKVLHRLFFTTDLKRCHML